jgi:hypothetical protein
MLEIYFVRVRITWLVFKETSTMVAREEKPKCHDINKELAVKAYPVMNAHLPSFRLLIFIYVYFLDYES